MILEQIPREDSSPAICVIGSGPVGMALALELEQLGRDVLVLESGDRVVDDKIAEASRAVILDPRRHADMSLTVCRALGGTSWTWGGRCVPYDEVDFAERDFVADACWPIGHKTISPWYRLAAKYLLCGNDQFLMPYARELRDGLSLDWVERWATNSRIIEVHRDALIASSRIRTCLRSTVVGLKLTSDGRSVEALEVATPAGQRTVKARNFILAAGGVETTRLLLWFQQKYPSHFGGIDGPLGRYYMGHLSGKIASLQLEDPESFRDFDFYRDSSGAFYRRRFLLTEEMQIANKLLNTVFWPDNPPFYDASHRSFVLSATFLALAFPATGRRILPEAIRLAHTGPQPYRIAPHLRNVVIGAPGGAMELYRVLRDRFLTKPRKPGFLVPNKGGRYALHYHAEQVPSAQSRIRLTDEKDAYDVPRASIDLRYCDQDVESVVASHRHLDGALRANRIGHLLYKCGEDEIRDQVWETAGDGYHQIGGVRMGIDPRLSVVDPDLNVHGLSNLTVASSAVFPSGGQANSTLLAVAFAMRLAHRLAA
ncbi:MAG TPA: GMC oxidoreductase [Terracidiphilus sp.]|jgi:choline dehydrogenase-like flavoprotein